jgi:hypothetical protein
MAPPRALIDQDADGSALGASFIAVFGAIWAFAGASALDGEVRVFVLGVAVALATALVL